MSRTIPQRTFTTFIWMKHSCVAEAAEATPIIPACVIITVTVKFKALFQMSTSCLHFVSATAISVLTSLKLFYFVRFDKSKPCM